MPEVYQRLPTNDLVDQKSHPIHRHVSDGQRDDIEEKLFRHSSRHRSVSRSSSRGRFLRSGSVGIRRQRSMSRTRSDDGCRKFESGSEVGLSSRQSSNSSVLKKNFEADVDEPEIIYKEIRRNSSNGTSTLHEYRRDKYLGKGGFAKVYEVTSLETGKVYACKVVPKANLVKSRARQKLQTEIKIHRVLKHRHICEYKHFFEDSENCYILLELCPHQSMNELIKRRKRLIEPEVVYYMKQLITGLSYMHSNNVIHRDLKLGNLFLGKGLTLKLGDLGLATKLSHSGERKKTICGTPNYIAPEIIDSKKTDRGHSFEVDIWSMGVIMFTLLVGKPPYESRDVKSTYKRILSNKYSFPSGLNLSDTARDLVSSMLQTNPSQRPSLETVRNHPFFFETPVPISLPTMCLTKAPPMEELQVEHRRTLAVRDSKGGKGRPTSSRRPLSSWDQNQMQTDSTGGKATSLGKVVNAFVRGSSSITTKVSTQSRPVLDSRETFNIYTDTLENDDPVSENELKKQPLQVGLLPNQSPMDDIIGKTATMTLEKERTLQSSSTKVAKTAFPQASLREIDQPSRAVPRSASMPSETHDARKLDKYALRSSSMPVENQIVAKVNKGTSQLKDEDAMALEAVYERLIVSLDPSRSGKEELNTLPLFNQQCWISCYVDYTSKYGLGFLLNDGSSGVYFNDSTKIVLGREGKELMYVERKSQDGKNSVRTSIYTLSNFPPSLQKKITLLNHFRSYLFEQEKGKDVKCTKESNGLDSGTLDYVSESKPENTEFIFLKKWVRTRHAILFRLSDHTVQVVFFDHSEVIISAESGLFIYVNKSGDRSSLPLSSALTDERTDIVKRLRYAKDILHQLIYGGTK
uniref:Serine/threonine-protein kinase PLK n=1 Tax=Corethron hystrix TaxID=216773 RepID=A0A7S1BAX8_9STRA|mmetsp:Transcript_18776/g.42839  ORF Transcript_18776/g.42839 Transcript_18776/m.42839 type:complete len:861 (+) Transcript_18776:267-2849(+)